MDALAIINTYFSTGGLNGLARARAASRCVKHEITIPPGSFESTTKAPLLEKRRIYIYIYVHTHTQTHSEKILLILHGKKYAVAL